MNKPHNEDSSLHPQQDPHPNRLIRCEKCSFEYTAKSMTRCPQCAGGAQQEFTQKTVNDSDLFK